MARRPTRAQLRRQFEALADEWSPRVRDAFLAAVADIANRAELGRIIERLERGDIAGAIDAVHLDPAAYRALETALTGAFGAGGAATVAGLPVLRDPTGANVVIRFDVRAPRAEAYLREHSAQLVTRIIDEQRQAIRSVLETGLIEGRNPRTTALDIIGRTTRATNSRVGGIIGLSAPQAQAVDKARSALTSGDPAAMRDYLNLTRRDKRFDATVRKAIAEGKALPADVAQRITGRYSDRLLQLRGETIARTETLSSLHASKAEAFEQAIDTGAVQRSQVKKQWIATRDSRSRDHHASADRERVGLDERFSTGLLYPHEPGAPASEVINCRCDYEHVIDFLAGFGQ
ncbi:MAG: head morphogenesis protein [Rhizobiales bacterium]|nr:head morphogenesis protein [Hyphomicrobiales bacterium]